MAPGIVLDRPGPGLVLCGALLLALATRADQAWVPGERANVRLGAGTDAPVIGELERGARVQVATDRPDLTGWTRLEPYGAVRTRLLTFTAPAHDDPLAGPFRYVRVRARSTELRAEPDADAEVVAQRRRGHILAVRDAPTGATGWLETPHGEFVLRSAVRPLEPSSFHGVVNPPARLAFVLHPVTPSGAPGGMPTRLARGAVVEVLLEAGKKVVTTSGTLSRAAVRVAWARPRPPGVGPAERWVHVDTDEQTLTAYEGDRLVFATLVSTGKPGWETPVGTFRVWLKVRHAQMHGHRVPYLVEEVPDILYFGQDVALHAAVWHDRFGTPVSHGCVNLSLADGDWIFRWAPPEIPDGWHLLNPAAAGLPALWVVVEGTPPPATTPAPVPLSARSTGAEVSDPGPHPLDELRSPSRPERC